jgi:hypothetical protein
MVAQLQPIDLVAPGFRGLNLEQQKSILPPVWATVAQNATISEDGLLASRRGYSDITPTALAGGETIETLFESNLTDGTREILCAWDDTGGNGISKSITDPDNVANIVDGAVVVTNGTWWFQNGWNKVFGFQDGQKPIVRTTGNFATVVEASGTAPTVAGGVGLVAYGRIWAVDSNKQIIKYCALQDETNWTTGAGQIDMKSIWTNGVDQVTAIIAFNGALVVFGHRHIVFWTDGRGNQLGIDPNNLYVADVIEGTGCESQWSIQKIGEQDVFFLSKQGVQSLRRLVETGASTGIVTLSRKVTTTLLSDLARVTDLTTVRSVVEPNRGIYILTMPAASRSWVFHYTRPYRDEVTGATYYPITTWSLAPASWCWDTTNQRLLLGFAGNVGLYGGSDTDNGTTFTLEYQSPYLDLGENVANRLKILKRIGSIIFVTQASSVTYKWDFDFRGDFSSKTVSFAGGTVAEWGTAEFGIAEYSGGLALRIFKFPATGNGQYIKLGLTLPVTSLFAIQQLELFAKLGALA